MFDIKDQVHVVFGVANQKSICYPIAKKLQESGARVVLVSHPSIQQKPRFKELANELGASLTIPCDVTKAGSIQSCFSYLKIKLGCEHIHGVVHGVAFSDKDELQGRYIDTSLENFLTTLHVSCYSFTEIARVAEPFMAPGGSLLTLTFDASQGTYPHYNVMALAKSALETSVKYLASDLGERGVRVNAISSSPEDTLSARGISGFRHIGGFASAMSPLGRRATVEEIANDAVYLLSPLASGKTGTVSFVDCGSSVSTMPPARNAGMMAGTMSDIANEYQKYQSEGAGNES